MAKEIKDHHNLSDLKWESLEDWVLTLDEFVDDSDIDLIHEGSPRKTMYFE